MTGAAAARRTGAPLVLAAACAAPALGATQTHTSLAHFASGWGGGRSGASDGNCLLSDIGGGEVRTAHVATTVGPFVGAGAPLPVGAARAGVALDRFRLWTLGGDGTSGGIGVYHVAPVTPSGQIASFSAPGALPAAGTTGGALAVNGCLFWLTRDALHIARLLEPGALGPASSVALPRSVSGAALSFCGGFLFVAGGRLSETDPSSAVAAVHGTCPNPEGGVGPWRTLAPLPSPRSHAAAAGAGDHLFVAGGFDASGSPAPSVFSAAVRPDGSLSAWNERDLLRPGGGAGWADGAALVAGGCLFLAGGTSGAPGQGTHLLSSLLDPESGALSPFAPAGDAPEPQGQALPLLGPALVAAAAGSLCLVGGGDGTTSYSQTFAAPLLAGREAAPRACAQGNFHNQFDFGANAEVESVSFHAAAAAGAPVQARFRLAAPREAFGGWSAWRVAGAVPVKERARFLEYQVRLPALPDARGVCAPARLEEVSVSYSLLPEERAAASGAPQTPTPTRAPTPASSCYPDPYRAAKGSLTVRFLPSTNARLAIATASGKPVRGVAVSAAQAARGRALWDGRDSAGRVAAPGTYEYVVEADTGTYRGRFQVAAAAASPPRPRRSRRAR